MRRDDGRKELYACTKCVLGSFLFFVSDCLVQRGWNAAGAVRVCNVRSRACWWQRVCMLCVKKKTNLVSIFKCSFPLHVLSPWLCKNKKNTRACARTHIHRFKCYVRLNFNRSLLLSPNAFLNRVKYSCEWFSRIRIVLFASPASSPVPWRAAGNSQVQQCGRGLLHTSLFARDTFRRCSWKANFADNVFGLRKPVFLKWIYLKQIHNQAILSLRYLITFNAVVLRVPDSICG